jgi:hypothetical protein
MCVAWRVAVGAWQWRQWIGCVVGIILSGRMVGFIAVLSELWLFFYHLNVAFFFDRQIW